MTVNATMTKFGHPDTLIADYACWTVQLRPRQVTLGSLVLIAKSPVTAFHEIGSSAFAELEAVTADIAAALTAVVGYERINYLMLMMVDPDVHFHVIPRYSTPRNFGAIAFPDAAWPGPPDLKSGIEPDLATRDALLGEIRSAWRK